MWPRTAFLAATIAFCGGLFSVHPQFRNRPRPTSKSQIPDDRTVPSRSKVFFQRGVNFTSETGYFPDDALAVLDRLPGYGVNSIALIPYGVAKMGVPEVRLMANGGMEREDDIRALTALAHRRNLKVLLKPQIWVTSGGYPGGIDFPDPQVQRAQLSAQRHPDCHRNRTSDLQGTGSHEERAS